MKAFLFDLEYMERLIDKGVIEFEDIEGPLEGYLGLLQNKLGSELKELIFQYCDDQGYPSAKKFILRFKPKEITSDAFVRAVRGRAAQAIEDAERKVKFERDLSQTALKALKDKSGNAKM